MSLPSKTTLGSCRGYCIPFRVILGRVDHVPGRAVRATSTAAPKAQPGKRERAEITVRSIVTWRSGGQKEFRWIEGGNVIQCLKRARAEATLCKSHITNFRASKNLKLLIGIGGQGYTRHNLRLRTAPHVRISIDLQAKLLSMIPGI